MMSSYGARHSIPPNVRIGFGIGIGGLTTSLQPSAQPFCPAAAVSSPLAAAKHGLMVEIRRLREVLASLAVEAQGDAAQAREMELLRAQIARLAEVLIL